MQNSLERIFAALAAQLRDVVAPGLSDPYAKAQALAMVEVLGNLATRVEWRCDQLREVVLGVRETLGPEAAPDPAELSNEQLLEARRGALAALAAAQAAEPGRFAGLAARLLAAELGRLRTGMYR
jgi:hypothetical protein